VKTGDAIQKMSIRTGVSTEALSQLGFAAEQSGSNLEALGKGFKMQANFIEDAKDGLATATDAMGKLGLSVDMFKGKTPEQTFMILSSAIAGIEDPMQRAALAQDVFSRAGNDLLPMFAAGTEGIAAFRAEADALGLTMSQDDANAAAQFSDSLNALKQSVGAVGLQIGKALVPMLNDLMPKITEIVTKVIDWMKENPKLFKTITMVVGGIGGLLVLLGPLLVMLPGIVVAFKAVAAVAAFVAGALSWPVVAIGLLIAAAVAVAVAIVKNWDEIKTATKTVFNWIADKISGVVDGVKEKIAWMIQAIERGIEGLKKLMFWRRENAKEEKSGGGGSEGRASGGLTRAATTMVGERGPELLSLPRGSRVLSHPDMMRAASSGGLGSGGGGGGGLGGGGGGSGGLGSGGGGGIGTVNNNFTMTVNEAFQNGQDMFDFIKIPLAYWLNNQLVSARS
jgi:hypothetical protein